MRFFRRRVKSPTAAEPGLSVLHHNVYGAAGYETTVRVVPTPEDRAQIGGFILSELSAHPPLSFDEQQTTRLVLGYSPRDMDDKWLVFAEDTPEGASVFFVRSWTGSLIFRLDLTIANGAATATALTWETDPTVLKTSGYEFAITTILEICRWVLRMEPPPVLR